MAYANMSLGRKCLSAPTHTNVNTAKVLQPARLVRLSGRPVASRRSRRVQATSLDLEDQKMRAAEARWENQIREGKVRNISGKDAGDLLKEGWVLLDVRPKSETSKVGITDAVEVPIFVEDTSMAPGSLIKQMSAFGMGGWWLGGTHMVANANFLPTVQARIPKDAKVIVGCQKGLRSLAACEQLSRAGYGTLAWVNGGFDTVRQGDLPTTEGKDIRYAGIGGVSSVLGWTEVQQEEKKGFAGGFENILKLVGLVLVLDGLVFAYEQLQYMQGAGGN